MATKLHGVPVKLYQTTQTGTDDFGAPIYTEEPVTVDNVLVGSPTSTEVQDILNLTGKKVVYMLGIPKNDSNDWTNKKVELPAPFSGIFRTIRFEITGIQDLIPMDWGRNIPVERYD